MSLTYFKRFRMELPLGRAPLPPAQLPDGYSWAEWTPGRCLVHARVKYESFVDDIDSEVFPCLGNRTACRILMYEIAQHPGFRPAATWLVEWDGNELSGPIPCGTIQGISVSAATGSIQNVGVTVPYRGLGIGRALVLKALEGFQAGGSRRVTLEVTASNDRAVRLYRSLGFKITRTSYRKVDIPRTQIAPLGSH